MHIYTNELHFCNSYTIKNALIPAHEQVPINAVETQSMCHWLKSVAVQKWTTRPICVLPRSWETKSLQK